MRSSKTKQMVLTAMLFATAMVLSILEGMLPLPIPVPGVRFGLSNIVVMYALFFLNKREAFSIAILKGVFAALTRGVVAGFLSMAGGIFALLAMSLFMTVWKEKGSYFFYSMIGAVSHNIGQFAAISIIYTNMALIYYLPVLLVSGMAAGLVTSILLKFILPALQKLNLGERLDDEEKK
ncbi:MAG: Gx transporter family protein [Acetivibrio sp.]